MSYRDVPLAPIRCPRCTRPLPPLRRTTALEDRIQVLERQLAKG